eukprot:2946887-Amphidinium_carterae.1
MDVVCFPHRWCPPGTWRLETVQIPCKIEGNDLVLCDTKDINWQASERAGAFIVPLQRANVPHEFPSLFHFGSDRCCAVVINDNLDTQTC